MINQPSLNNNPTTTPLIVGIAGRAGSGKGAVARYLAERRGFLVTAFATPIKEIIADIFPTATHHDLHGFRKDVVHRDMFGRTPRDVMKIIGDRIRSKNSETMANLWYHSLTRWSDEPPGSVWVHDKIVVEDLRYPEEAELLSDVGAKLIRITRPDLLSGEESPHESELGEFAVDRELINSGSLAALHRSVEDFLGLLA